MRNCVQFFAETHENVEGLTGLFFLHNKFLGMACFGFQLDTYRLLFDRGKF
ncbi:hypothetical protein MKX03_035049, partial [Papaver bracteatum]